MSESLLRVENVEKFFPIRGGLLFREIARVSAVNDVSLEVKMGETVGLVGESGCGKSTLGRVIAGLYKASGGKVIFNGHDMGSLSKSQLREQSRDIQVIFQDPYESLNPRHAVGYILEEPFLIHRMGTPGERRKWVDELLETVGLPSDAKSKFPHEFSGGQRQRIGIARAIALKPKLIICDEPVSALDVSIQSQIMNLLIDLQRERGLAFLFIAHNLSVVKHCSDRIAIMYLGRIVEFADAHHLHERPLHPYSQALISAIPVPDPTLEPSRHILEGEVPSPVNLPSGCHFHTRCPFAQERCRTDVPPLRDMKVKGEFHQVACHYAGEVSFAKLPKRIK